MKWKNEYIVGLTWNKVPFTLAMTLILSEDADAQTILAKVVKLAADHICKVAKVEQVQTKDLHIYMCNMVKQKLITEEEAEKL